MTKPYAAAHFALELDGRNDIGLFRSIEGGGVKADVMTYQYGHAYEKWRSLGKPKFEDMKVQVGMAMSKPFYDWIEKFFAGEVVRKNGAIVAADFDYNERARREFTNAMIRELTFPKLEGKDPQPIFMSVSLAVETMRFTPGRGSKIQQGQGAGKQKDWRGNKFRLGIDGFEQACRNCTKIDPFTIKQNIIEHHTGGFREPSKHPSQIEFPQISFYVPEMDAAPFFNYVHQRIHEGQSSRNGVNGKNGYIQTYDSAGGRLFTLEFFGADIFAVTPDNGDAGKAEFKMVKIDMYTERMRFEYTQAGNGMLV